MRSNRSRCAACAALGARSLARPPRRSARATAERRPDRGRAGGHQCPRRQLRHHRHLRRLPRPVGDQRPRLHRRGDPRPISQRCAPAASCPLRYRSATCRSTRCGCWRRSGRRVAGNAYGDVRRHVIVYRSAWTARILVARAEFCAARIEAVRKFCDERSFDVSYYPGIDLVAARANIYNDLPAVSFATGEVTSTGPDDAIADEAGPVLRGQPTEQQQAFNLAPITLRPAVLLRGAPPRPSRHDPEAAGGPAAGGDRSAGEPRRPGAGRRDRDPGAAVAAGGADAAARRAGAVVARR